MRRTKIVCTIGPASDSPSTLRALIRAGMNVARLNFSHGTYATHSATLKKIRAAARAEKKTITILQDLQGPKIRVGELPEAGVRLAKGEELTLTTKKTAFDEKKRLVMVSYAGMHRDLKSGDRLLLDDGLLELEVAKISGHEIHTRVIVGGVLFSHKGVNVPTATLHVDAMTEKDKNDLAFGLTLNVDWIALSFVTSAEQVKRLKKMIHAGWKGDRPEPRVIVKIEKHEALAHFDEILAAADAVMVARGDLGVETPAIEVPIEQKVIIEKCLAAAKPVVVATQMLDSMMRNPRATRAEISDIANAIIDHADATMLSGETASGKYPLEAVKTMAGTIEATEASRFDDRLFPQAVISLPARNLMARVRTATELALEAKAKALVIATDTGEKVRLASSLRQELPIVALVPNDRLARQLSLSWGVTALVRADWNRLKGAPLKKILVTHGILTKAQSCVFLGEPKTAGAELIA